MPGKSRKDKTKIRPDTGRLFIPIMTGWTFATIPDKLPATSTIHYKEISMIRKFSVLCSVMMACVLLLGMPKPGFANNHDSPAYENHNYKEAQINLQKLGEIIDEN